MIKDDDIKAKIKSHPSSINTTHIAFNKVTYKLSVDISQITHISINSPKWIPLYPVLSTSPTTFLTLHTFESLTPPSVMANNPLELP